MVVDDITWFAVGGFGGYLGDGQMWVLFTVCGGAIAIFRCATRAIIHTGSVGVMTCIDIRLGELAPARFGAAVWAGGYVVLPLLGVYKPIWKYDLETLAKDLSAHLVFGTATAAAYSILTNLEVDR